MDYKKYFFPIKGIKRYEINYYQTVRRISDKKVMNVIEIKGYYGLSLSINSKYKTVGIHRLMALAFIPNEFNYDYVDHIDGNKHNNDISNLRWSTSSQNNQNKGIQSNNKSGVKGVVFEKKTKKWKAQIMCNGKNFTIGRYIDIEDAKQARQLKAKQLFGEYTNKCEL